VGTVTAFGYASLTYTPATEAAVSTAGRGVLEICYDLLTNLIKGILRGDYLLKSHGDDLHSDPARIATILCCSLQSQHSPHILPPCCHHHHHPPPLQGQHYSALLYPTQITHFWLNYSRPFVCKS
jgi:hypothetical protein